jgi:hypothetical protein
MKAAHLFAVVFRAGLSLAFLAALAWCSVLLLPALSDAQFSEMKGFREQEIAKRMGGDMSFWGHQPQIIAARQVGPFVHPALSALILATFPAFRAGITQVKQPIISDLPLLKQESWRAFYFVTLYSALMWFVLGTCAAGVVVGFRALFRRSSRAMPGAG